MGDCRFCLLYKMNMKKFACAAVFAVAMVACVGFFVANEQEESIKYMPSVSALTGTNLFPDEDKASTLSDDSDDDDDSSSSSDSTPSFEEMFGGGGASSDASSSGSGDTVSSGDSVTVQYKFASLTARRCTASGAMATVATSASSLVVATLSLASTAPSTACLSARPSTSRSLPIKPMAPRDSLVWAFPPMPISTTPSRLCPRTKWGLPS